MEKFKDYKIIIWGHPYDAHTHSWIHYGFYRAFQYMGYETSWASNDIKNLPPKNQKTIFITEHQEDSTLLENMSDNWIIFDHNYGMPGYKRTTYWNQKGRMLPFCVKVFAYPNNPYSNLEMYQWYLGSPKILWATDLLPHEIKFTPYHYSNTKDITFIGSYWPNNWLELEQTRLWSVIHGKIFNQKGKHILLRYKKFVPEDEIVLLSSQAYIAPSIQGGFQCNNGYIPCRLLKNMSYSVLGVSNNLYVANLFQDDEIIIDKNIWNLMNKTEKVIRDKKVDEYTKRALERVKNEHTYINRIEELFSYL